MSFNVEIAAGSNKRLLVGGKYCTEDIVVSSPEVEIIKPEEVTAAYNTGKKEFLNAFWNAKSIYEKMKLTLGTAVLNDGYITITPRPNSNGSYSETYFTLAIDDSLVTGEYCVIKYKIAHGGVFELFTSTISSSASKDNCMQADVIGNGEWNILVFNAAEYLTDRFIKDADGEYRAKYIRFDVFNGGDIDDIDVAYVGICDSFEKALAFADLDKISYVEAIKQTKTISTHYDKIASFYATDGLRFEPLNTCSECGFAEYAVSGYSGIDTNVVIPPLYITDDYECYPVREIKADAFRARYFDIAGVTIPSSVRVIGQYAFYNTPGIRRLKIGEGVREIRQWSFYNAVYLNSINIPDSVEFIGQQAFQSCTKAKSLRIGKGLKSIGYATFYRCESLESIMVAANLESIAKLAFAYCEACLEYDFTACTTVPQLADVNAFDGINVDCKIYVPAALLDEWKAATNWAEYADYIVAAE